MPVSSAPVTGSAATTVLTGTLSLPVGSTLAPATLTISNALGSTTPNANGTFALTTYAEGPQFTVVTDVAGNPVLYGFVGPGSTTLDVTSSAKVLAYFGAALYTLPSPYRAQIVDQLASVNGFAALQSAFAAAIAQNPESLAAATSAAPVAQALSSFVSSLFAPTATTNALTRSLGASLRTRFSIVVNPSDTHSGITVINDFPSGVHFDNTFRRSAKAFIDEASYVDANGNVVQKAVTDVVAPVSIPAVSGLGNITSSLISTVQNLYTGATAYTPVDTSTTPLALEPGSSRTRYTVTVVGAGLGGPTLSAEQTQAQRFLAGQQLVQDFLVPIVQSFVLPIGSAKIDASFGFDGANGAISDFIGNLLVSAPQIVDLMNGGMVADALQLAVNTLASSNTLQAALLQIVVDQLRNSAGTDVTEAAIAKGNRLLLVLNVASGVTTGFDVGVVSKNILSSSAADVFTVDVTDDKVTLTPATVSIDTTHTQSFTVNVPSASGSSETLVYHWHNSANNGTLTDGLPGHTDDFDSSSNVVTYAPKASGNGNDTITATVYLVGLKGARTPIGLPQTSTVTVVPTLNVSSAWPLAAPPQTTPASLTGGGSFSTSLTGLTFSQTVDGYAVVNNIESVTPSSTLDSQYTESGFVPRADVAGIQSADNSDSPQAPNRSTLLVLLVQGYHLPLNKTYSVRNGQPCTSNCTIANDSIQAGEELIFPDIATRDQATAALIGWFNGTR